MSAHLSEAERDSLTECECGHFLNEHSSDGCLATDFSEDWRPLADDDKCSCGHSPTAINRHAIEAILTARVAAAVAAEREAWVGKIETAASAIQAETLAFMAAYERSGEGVGTRMSGESAALLVEAREHMAANLRALIAEARPLERGTELPSEPGTDLEARS